MSDSTSDHPSDKRASHNAGTPAPDGSSSIQTVTVIGAGTMGAAIAGHLANAGLQVVLLDMAPQELTPEEEAAGATLADPAVRNRIVQSGFDRMVQARPANLFAPSVAQRIRLGNLKDDLAAALAASDWIIEAIVERLAPKQELMARIEPLAPPHAVITTNTSGLPIGQIGAGRSPAFRRRFLGAHFFNPPRYLPLMELIPTEETDPRVTQRLHHLLTHTLGKGVVRCKDTPNFIANRMVSYILADVIDYAIRHEYTVPEVDALTGPLLGRPRSATFRLNDIVGVDVWAQIAENLHPMIPDDPARDVLIAPDYRRVLQTLIEADHLGSKRGQGFYKTVVDDQGNKSFWGLDLQAAATEGAVAYQPPDLPEWPSVESARRLPLPERLRSLVAAGDDGDRAGRLIRHTVLHTLAYAAQRIPEITDSPQDIDRALTWGFGWEMGPFAIWDALGAAETAGRMEALGISVAPWVKTMLDQGHTHFYRPGSGEDDGDVYDPVAGAYRTFAPDPHKITVDALQRRRPPLAQNEAASLLDMGDGVLLLAFHSKANALDTNLFPILDAALERLHGGAGGLVIGNDGLHFSVGANLHAMLAAAEAGEWQQIEDLIQGGQTRFLGLRTAPRPVVAAPFQRVLGGGIEICLAAHHIVAHAETYTGLVEAGVGLIPGWGGCKEMIRRHVQASDPASGLHHIFGLVTRARVSTSALDAQELGYFDPSDAVIMRRDHLLQAARQAVLAMGDDHTPPPITQNIYAAGSPGLDALQEEISARHTAGDMSDHDARIAGELAYVISGGVTQPAYLDEQAILDLERAAFLRLIRTQESQDRIRHMLQTGRPLRN